MAAQVKRDYRQATLDVKTRALLDFVVEVTQAPQKLSGQNVARLREAGWTDEEILTAVHIIGFFNYYARLADALGVEPEDFMKKSPAPEVIS